MNEYIFDESQLLLNCRLLLKFDFLNNIWCLTYTTYKLVQFSENRACKYSKFSHISKQLRLFESPLSKTIGLILSTAIFVQEFMPVSMSILGITDTWIILYLKSTTIVIKVALVLNLLI